MKLAVRALGMGVNTLALLSPRQAGKVALDVFCKMRAGRHKPYHADYLSQYEHQMVGTGRGPMAVYRRRGPGPTVLLCHGYESNAFRWRKLLAYLADTDYDIYMMEAPAHGASDGDRFTALWYGEAMLDVCRLCKPEVIVGHSVGAFAMSYMLAHHEVPTLRNAILMAPPDTFELITDNYFDLLGYSHRVRQAYDAIILEQFGHPLSYFNASDFMSRVGVPGIVIHDTEDHINGYVEGEAVARQWTDGRLITTTGLGHSLQDLAVYEIIEGVLLAVR